VLGFWARWGSLVSSLLLVAGTLALYWPVTGFSFVNLDDPYYVTSNPHVQGGSTWAGLRWAMSTPEAANWHPLTWLAHMLDWQCYGMRAGGHHLTSVLLHMANAWLLFVLLKRMTGRGGRSFVVAALFAWHPLHVESVAWIAERKDVLSGLFFLLTLGAYVCYAEKPVARSQFSFASATLAGFRERGGGRGRFWGLMDLGLELLDAVAVEGARQLEAARQTHSQRRTASISIQS
jgi:protein O-mannosyl-transferase